MYITYRKYKNLLQSHTTTSTCKLPYINKEKQKLLRSSVQMHPANYSSQ